MNQIRNILDRLPFDPKLVGTIVSAVVTWALAKYAAGLDPDVSAAITAAVASVVGYEVPNEGTDLRQGNYDNGNPSVPSGELGEEEVE